MANIGTGTLDNFDSVVNGELPVLVDFWAEWCGPCQMLGPVLEQIAAERDDLIVGKINVDEHPDLAGEYSVDTIPALLLFRNGKLEKRVAGFMNKDVLLSRLGL